MRKLPRYCASCRFYVSPEARHCEVCNVCILNLDHVRTDCPPSPSIQSPSLPLALCLGFEVCWATYSRPLLGLVGELLR